MAVPDIEAQAVLEFLKKNGLSLSESAFMEDILDSHELRSFHFEKFVSPILPPPPPPLNIPRPPSASAFTDFDSNHSPSSSSSSEEFVSLDSSTSDVCSSEFTNPYGIRTGTRTQASSDRLSQFGTARDYPDFEMQKELYWYTEKDEDYAMPPSLDNLDTLGGPTEDKFVMTQETDKHIEKQLDFNLIPDGFQSIVQSNYVDKLWPFRVTSKEDVSYSNLNKNVQNLFVGEDREGGKLYGCSAPICLCCAGDQGPYGDDHINYGKNFEMYEFQSKPTVENSAECDSDLDLNNHKNQTYSVKKPPRYDLVGDFKSTSHSCVDVVKKKFHNSNENGKYEYEFDREFAKKSSGLDVADDEGDVAVDELLICDPLENEYEVFDLRIIHRKKRTGFEENREFPIVLNSIIAGRYYVTEYLGSAAFSKVVQAQDLRTGANVCLKIIKNDKDFFDQSLDEIKLLKFVNKYDPGDKRHILRLYDYFYYQEHLFIVCELLRANLYEFQKYNRESGGVPYFTLSRLQVITRQCLEALEYLHDLRIIHCDLKPENILIKSYRSCEIKVIDLGSSCFRTDNLCLYVQSRSYRAPEVILGLPYDQKIDLWSLGCILAELYSGEVLFPNEAVVMLLARVIGLLGPIDMEMLTMGQETHKYFTQDYDLFHINEESNQLEYVIPEESSLEHHLQVSDDVFLDFLRNLLEINPQRRPSAREALQHRWLSHSYGMRH